MSELNGEKAAGKLPEGLYESLVTELLRTRLAKSPELQPGIESVDLDYAVDLLSRHIEKAVRAGLQSTKPEERLPLANRILRELDSGNRLEDGPKQLRSLYVPDTLKRRNLRRPTTNLSDSALLTNGKEALHGWW
ncbi:hypothetical protein [Arthrobacter roseus]|uniref:hypothetical protein n=1 Tax=Arthrobacter roseus TaxID=136274 RepID=UPI0019649062|nr:hypothetical protein [Arthrobacter roseus]MBM7847852.1 hypothetical protein [Arthrobacter roseus]